jgi:hypothetical protein
MSQQSRRRDPYPWTWEVPVGVVLMIFVGAGLRCTSWTRCRQCAGRGWLGVPWTYRAVQESARAVLGGDAGVGLTGISGHLSSPVILRVCVVATELMLIAV